MMAGNLSQRSLWLYQMQEELNSCFDLQLLKAHVKKYKIYYSNAEFDPNSKSANTVLYGGNPNSPIMLIGKAPGATEDQTGVPFRDAAGIILEEKYLKKHLQLDRNQVFLTNTFFWRQLH